MPNIAHRRRNRVFGRFSTMALAGMLSLATRVWGQDVWTLTSADFTQTRAAVLAFDDQTVRIRTVTGETQVIGWDRLLELDRGGGASSSGRAAGSASGLTLVRVNGDRITGVPVALVDESLEWETAFGPMRVSLRDVLRVEAPGSAAVVPDRPAEQDVVQLANGDRLAGVIDSLDGRALRLSVAGEVATLPWDAVSVVQLAGASVSQRAAGDGVPPRAFRVSLLGDSRLTVRSVAMVGEQLKLVDPDSGERSVPLKTVLAVEQLHGPVLWLTALSPVEATHTPYFAQLSLPPRMDRGAARDGPIRSVEGDRPARAGVGMASASRVTWNLPAGGYAAFRGQAVIDGNLPYANVVLRVLLDDKVAWEQADFTSASPPATVVLPLSGARKLTLEVDYGKTLDVQDRVNWVEPALLRTLPTTQPGG